MTTEQKTSYKPPNPILMTTKRWFSTNYGTLLALLALSALIALSEPNFATEGNVINILRQVSINGIIAIGLTMSLLIGGVDLSVGSTCAAAGCLVVKLFESPEAAAGTAGGLGWNVWGAILFTLFVGGLIGLFNGIFVANTNLPFFVITLATQMTVRGIAYWFTGGYPILSNNDTFNKIGNGNIEIARAGTNPFQIPYPVIIMIVLFIIYGVLLSRTRFGRHVYAIGGNREAAIHSGINVRRILTIIYVNNGVLASIAGIILASRMLSGQPTVGIGYEGEAIAASVLGGVSFSGGFGTISSTIIGSLILGVVNNGMNVLGLQFYFQYIAKGLIILFAVYFDSIKNTFLADRKAKRQLKKEGIV